jgi:hypothetical protein
VRDIDPVLAKQVEKLHQLTIYGRWLMVVLFWLTLGLLGIWGLRSEFPLWREYFTWSAVRYGLAFNRLSAMSLAFCIGMTAAVLVWQSKVILWGLSDRERYRLEQEVMKIRSAGPSHPLWKWII